MQTRTNTGRLKVTTGWSYHGADHSAHVDGVRASCDVSGRVLCVFVVEVQYLHANGHHIVLKLETGEKVAIDPRKMYTFD